MLTNIIDNFFPKLYEITHIYESNEIYEFWLESRGTSSKCPVCGRESTRIHSSQQRTARDLPILDRGVILDITQKRYYCDNEECEVQIFTEANNLILPYSQFTVRCRAYMLKVAGKVSCEAAVRILAYQKIRVSGDTLLNMLKEAGKEYKVSVGKNIGVDDWAYRRGHEYGTIICDLDTNDVIEVVKGRDSETLGKWLLGHADIEIVSRDRASSYSSAVKKVLPQAVQIADRFHITKNLLEALSETMRNFMQEEVYIPNSKITETEESAKEKILGEPAKKISSEDKQTLKKNTSTLSRQESQMQYREKVQDVHLLKAEGYRNGQIAEMKGVSHKTVARMLRMNTEYLRTDGTSSRNKYKLLNPYRKVIYELVERGFKNADILKKLHDMFPGANIKRATLGDFCMAVRAELFEYTESEPKNLPGVSNDSVLALHIEKIHTMLNGNKSVTMIFSAIHSEGYFGSYSVLAQYCRKIKPVTHINKKDSHKVTRRDLSDNIWSGKPNLSDDDIAYMNENYPIFDEIKSIITEFRTAYSGKNVEAVKSWCDKYAQCKFPAVCSFINGVNIDDTDAFYNSMKYDYNNGLLEGSVNKLKTIKRSMYGRASYALLRAKLLLANGN